MVNPYVKAVVMHLIPMFILYIGLNVYTMYYPSADIVEAIRTHTPEPTQPRTKKTMHIGKFISDYYLMAFSAWSLFKFIVAMNAEE